MSKDTSEFCGAPEVPELGQLVTLHLAVLFLLEVLSSGHVSPPFAPSIRIFFRSSRTPKPQLAEQAVVASQPERTQFCGQRAFDAQGFSRVWGQVPGSSLPKSRSSMITPLPHVTLHPVTSCHANLSHLAAHGVIWQSLVSGSFGHPTGAVRVRFVLPVPHCWSHWLQADHEPYFEALHGPEASSQMMLLHSVVRYRSLLSSAGHCVPLTTSFLCRTSPVPQVTLQGPTSFHGPSSQV